MSLRILLLSTTFVTLGTLALVRANWPRLDIAMMEEERTDLIQRLKEIEAREMNLVTQIDAQDEAIFRVMSEINSALDAAEAAQSSAASLHASQVAVVAAQPEGPTAADIHPVPLLPKPPKPLPRPKAKRPVKRPPVKSRWGIF